MSFYLNGIKISKDRSALVTRNLKFAKLYVDPTRYGVYRNNFKRIGFINLITNEFISDIPLTEIEKKDISKVLDLVKKF